MKPIFLFEINYWLRRPNFYIFFGIFLVFSAWLMAVQGGAFDNGTATVVTNVNINAPKALNDFINGFSVFLYFLLPAIFGASIHKDFQYRFHQLFYAYPYTKGAYFAGKFLSAFLVALAVYLSVAIGAFLGTVFPGVNSELVGPQDLRAYLQPFWVYVIPNLLFFGALVFALVTLFRNNTVGYIAILLLFVLQSVGANLMNDLDTKTIGALLDPFGSLADMYYTEYWTINEQNTQYIPTGKFVLLNRLIWMGVGLGLLAISFFNFNFSPQGISLVRRKSAPAPAQAYVPGNLLKIRLPKVSILNNGAANLKRAWRISVFDFRYILTNGAFLVILAVGILFIVVTEMIVGQIFQTETYPVTWRMVAIPGAVFRLFVVILTFLYSGMIIQRARSAKMDQLIDTTLTPNWTFLLGKFLALVKMLVVLMIVVMIAGMGVQAYNGYFKFEVGQYLTSLLGLNLVNYVIWACLAVLIHSLIRNYYIGFFVLLLLWILFPFLPDIGVEQDIFQFNAGPGYNYSDMNGYGASVIPYLAYKAYWLALGLFFLGIAFLFWRRGLTSSVKERLAAAAERFRGPAFAWLGLTLAVFLGLGVAIYRDTNVQNEFISSKESEQLRVRWEKQYSRFDGMPQPRITDVSISLDLYPRKRNYYFKGHYLLKNKTDRPIDTLLINGRDIIYTFEFNRPLELVAYDDSLDFSIYRFGQPLMPGDTLRLDFTAQNRPNTWLTSNSGVAANGTFLNNSLLPSIGYSAAGELTDDKQRKKYGLEPKDRMPSPLDPNALRNNYISNDADWINFEATVSTVPDQIAIAPGYLQKEWTENGRRYFHYQMDSRMLNFYAFVSGKYEVVRDEHEGVAIEIYHHSGHEYNLDRMIKAARQGLTYYFQNFSPYQHRQFRIIEFPNIYGTFAQSFANTVPFSETIGFIAKVDDSEEGGVDYPFTVTAHELAHQWWAHQVIGAMAQGATVMSESLSEYSALKVLEEEYGEDKMRIFLKDALDKYLQGRTLEGKKEQPLAFVENQQYIHYNKGSLVLYALSDYIGADTMNAALSRYIDSVAFQDPPYTTSLELIGFLREATPDSLQYLIEDMFETITLYDNKVNELTVSEEENGAFTIEIAVQARKYRNDDQGKMIRQDAEGNFSFAIEADGDTLKSLPLQDYIEIGIFNEEEEPLYLRKHLLQQVFDTLRIRVDQRPAEVGIDPYNKLIDRDSNDNRKRT